MSQCPSCGTVYTGTPRFCANCGARLRQQQTQPVQQEVQPAEPRRVCTACRVTWPLAADFCGRCGRSLRGKAPVKPEQPKCFQCGQVLQPGRNYCGVCGKVQPEAGKCPGCGSTLRPGSLFCGACGREKGVDLPQEDKQMFRGVLVSMLRQDKRPTTLQELMVWCRQTKISPERHGFHLGHSNIPGDFTLQLKDNRFAFCRVTDQGETHVFYMGRDEAFAINGFWHTLLDRLGMWPLPEEYRESTEV